VTTGIQSNKSRGRRVFILDADGEQRGPYKIAIVMRLLNNGTLKPTDWAWSNVKEEWVRLADLLEEYSRPASIAKASPHGRSIALATGWTFLALGILTFYFSRFGLLFFLGSFALSAVAMTTNRVNQGILLNILTFVASEYALQLLLS